MATIKDLKRMCDSYKKCDDCPFDDMCFDDSVSCLPDNTAYVVVYLIKEHPIKTYAMDFFEKFPNAPKDRNGAPRACWKQVYGKR